MRSPDSPVDDAAPLPPQALFLKRLVLALAVVMIAGFLALIVTLIVKLSVEPRILPDSLTLPEGARALAFTQGPDWFAVVTDDERILIYDRDSGVLVQTLRIER
ncbi:MAG: hypothetical protein H3C51_01255 [Rubellimicrobium sp.]|nr:hypothetical protein [Rubellimicrobium sp.]